MNTTTPTPGLTGSGNTHARLSPSDSKRWVNCTASIAFQEANAHRVRKDDGSSYADAGTEAHEWCAKVLMGQCTIDGVPEIGSYGDDLRIHVKTYTEYCMSQVTGAEQSIIKAMLEDKEASELLYEGYTPPEVAYFVEEQVPLYYQSEQYGTADFIGIVAEGRDVKRVVSRDLKFGAGVLVTNDDNTQLAIYIYSAIKSLENVYSFHPDTEIDLAVHQPRHREGAEQKPWVITLADLATFCQEIEYHAIRARIGAERVRAYVDQRNEDLKAFEGEKNSENDSEDEIFQRFSGLVELGQDLRDVSPEEILEAAPGLRFHPEEGDGGSCRWCKCKAFCPKRLSAMCEGIDTPHMSAEELLACMPDLDKAEAKMPLEKRIELTTERLGLSVLTDEYLVRYYRSMKARKKFDADVEEYLEGRLLDGEEIDGVCLVLGREGNRAWANETEADSWLKNQGLKQEDRYDFKLKSPTAIEKVLAPKLKTVTRTANRFKELVARRSPKKVIALADDSRPALVSNIAAMPTIEDDEPGFD